VHCDEAEDLLIKRQDGQLPEPQAGELEAHLAGCERCRQFATGLTRLQKLLTADAADTPEPGDVDSMWEATSRRLARSRPQPRVLLLRGALIGSAALAAAGILLALGLWRWGAGLRQDIDALKQANTRLSEQLRQLPVQGGGHERGVPVHLADLDRSTRLYRELADFYRIPVLWVVEGNRGVEMKLGSESAEPSAAEASEGLVYVEVTVTDSLKPTTSTTARIISRSGQQVSTALEDWAPAGGRWRLQCSPSVVEGGGLAVTLTLKSVNGAESAVLTTQATLPAGTSAQLGSLTVAGRLYEVRVFVQQAFITEGAPAAGSEGSRT